MKTKMKVMVSPLQIKKLETGKSSMQIILQARRRKDDPIVQFSGVLTNISRRGEPQLLRGRGPPMHTVGQIAYEKNLEKIKRYLGHDGITSREELNRAGAHFLKTRFLGAYASDENYTLTRRQPYAIVNTTPSPGQHWQALALIDGDEIRYDSFGGDDGDTDPDPEQTMDEENCGQRALAFLLVLHKLGRVEAMSI